MPYPCPERGFGRASRVVVGHLEVYSPQTLGVWSALRPGQQDGELGQVISGGGEVVFAGEEVVGREMGVLQGGVVGGETAEIGSLG